MHTTVTPCLRIQRKVGFDSRGSNLHEKHYANIAMQYAEFFKGVKCFF